jgi:hypothetical protein
MKRLVQAIWKMLKAIWYLSFGVEGDEGSHE